MALKCWRVEFFDNRDDPKPSRVAHVYADNEDEASQFVADAMRDYERSDLTLTILPGVANPKGTKGVFY